MAGQNYTWQVSTPSIGTGKGVVSSAYNVNGESPLTTITSTNPNGFVKVNPLSNDPTVSKTEYKIGKDGLITYRYTGSNPPVLYNSIQELIDNRKVTPSVGYQIRSAVQSNIVADARQKDIGQAPIASLSPSAAVPGTGPAGNQVGSDLPSSIPIPEIKSTGTRKTYDDYVYPTGIRTNKQDFITFTAYEYVGRSLDIKNSSATAIDENLGFGERNIIKSKLGSATLPIQPSITDLNTVQWGGEEINPLSAYAASVSYNATTDIAGTGERVLNTIESIFKKGTDNSASNAFRLFLAGKAAGVNGLLSRVGSAVLNPNLELLFQGPQLRPFNFTFRLSPRDEKEAQQVKYIIRFFKQNMSVKNADINLFLKTPNVFQIKYHLAGDANNDHPSLNRIKICALQSCSIDYTPDNSYMTFNDQSATMTSYNLTLQFQELEPVTEKDYNDLNDETVIGY